MIAAIILAAGASRRMGEPKALLQLTPEGKSLLGLVVERAHEAGIQDLVVAVGPPHGELIQKMQSQLPVRWAWNGQPEQGMLSSVKAALPLMLPEASGTLIWPVDIPFVSVATIRALLATDLSQLVGPVCRGQGGHPLWLPRRLFVETMELPPESGLRGLRLRHPLMRVPVSDEEILRDLDTPEDLARARDYCGGG